MRLARKVGDRSGFETLGKKTVNGNCVARFADVATYKKATYRASWPKQDDDHRAGRSRAKAVRTH